MHRTQTIRCAATCRVPNSRFALLLPGSRKRISDVDEDGLALQLEKAGRCTAARRVFVFYCGSRRLRLPPRAHQPGEAGQR